MEVKTLVRIGIFDCDLERAVEGIKIDLIRDQNSKNTRYAVLGNYNGERYLAVLTQEVERRLTEDLYNTSLTVTSCSKRVNASIAEYFEGKMGMRLDSIVPVKLFVSLRNDIAPAFARYLSDERSIVK